MDYINKYQKYKNKYLNLRGGALTTNRDDIEKSFIDFSSIEKSYMYNSSMTIKQKFDEDIKTLCNIKDPLLIILADKEINIKFNIANIDGENYYLIFVKGTNDRKLIELGQNEFNYTLI